MGGQFEVVDIFAFGLEEPGFAAGAGVADINVGYCAVGGGGAGDEGGGELGWVLVCTYIHTNQQTIIQRFCLQVSIAGIDTYLNSSLAMELS